MLPPHTARRERSHLRTPPAERRSCARPLRAATALCLALAGPVGLGSSAAHAETASGRIRIAVLELEAVAGISDATRRLLDEAMLSEVEGTGRFQAFGSSDIRAMLGLERERMLAGCDTESCLTEIGGALGVDLLLTGSLGRVGDVWLVNLKVIDVRKAVVESRVTRKVDAAEQNESALVEATQGAAREVLLPIGVSKDERPLYKKWWFWTLVGVVAVGAGAGAVYALSPEDDQRTATFDITTGAATR